MYTIHLEDIILYGRHGVYQQELVMDAPFQISIRCILHEGVVVKELNDTVNYESVFNTVKDIFAQPYMLLEVLAADIAESIKGQNPVISQLYIRINKLNPLIPGLQGSVGVSILL